MNLIYLNIGSSYPFPHSQIVMFLLPLSYPLVVLNFVWIMDAPRVREHINKGGISCVIMKSGQVSWNKLKPFRSLFCFTVFGSFG